MATRLLIVLFFLPVFLYAQNEGDRSIQRLSWTGDENTRRYEIVIEKEEEGEYQELLREFTTALYIDVSLSPGKYRCLVITYDFLNQVGGGSEWMYIEVLAHSEADGPSPDFFLADTNTGLPVDKTDVKPDIFMSAAWMPSFTVSDTAHFFGQNRSLAGVTGRFGVLWDKPWYCNPGLELAVSYNFFDGSPVHLLAVGLNLSALKRIPGDKTALMFRLGAGYSAFLPEPAAEADGAAYLNMGISFLLFVMKNGYLETGIDYTHLFPVHPPSGCLRPWLGAGWRF
jgi:hypothetical protein